MEATATDADRQSLHHTHATPNIPERLLLDATGLWLARGGWSASTAADAPTFSAFTTSDLLRTAPDRRGAARALIGRALPMRALPKRVPVNELCIAAVAMV